MNTPMYEAAKALKVLCQKIPQEQAEAKNYHQGRGSFSFVDLIAEIEQGTSVGRFFAQTIRKAAEADGSTVDEYLNPKNPESWRNNED